MPGQPRLESESGVFTFLFVEIPGSQFAEERHSGSTGEQSAGVCSWLPACWTPLTGRCSSPIAAGKILFTNLHAQDALQNAGLEFKVRPESFRRYSLTPIARSSQATGRRRAGSESALRFADRIRAGPEFAGFRSRTGSSFIWNQSPRKLPPTKRKCGRRFRN